MAALTLDLIKHSGPTPADVTAPQIITDCGNFTLDFKQLGFFSSLPPDSRPWFPNEMQNLHLSGKRTLNHWATVKLFFSTALVRCFWRCFCFRSGLVALFLKMSEGGDSWCTDSSFSSLLVKLSQVFESALLDSILKLAVILLLVHLFLSNFFLPVNFVFNMLWYSTLWRATAFSNDPLWLTLFVEGVNDCLLDHCWVSSVPLYLWFQRTRDTPHLYFRDGHLMKLKCKYYNCGEGGVVQRSLQREKDSGDSGK